MAIRRQQPVKDSDSSSSVVVPLERIQRAIFLLRGEKVMFDADLARLYGVETRVLIQAVARNANRFPPDFVFRVGPREAEFLRSQIVISSARRTRSVARRQAEIGSILRSQTVISSLRHGGRRYLPYAFTEQGVAMLSSVLRSKRAAEVNVAIMRAFVALRRLLTDHATLGRKLTGLERRFAGHDTAIRSLFGAIRELMTPPRNPKREVGFHTMLPGLRQAREKAPAAGPAPSPGLLPVSTLSLPARRRARLR